ncbi:hypothetical protein OHA72_57790 [Dactylosporangium sp. NBC_01737]|uniref:hypothetical protein n=1 Tax=Dactylosporangium sp. NBC_01737 TaxID=2975959 RepID=UPI002E14C401|nr:hypothetical protein OHA72_57790 [Dactylosporangium sp. NBC_01737]
MSVRAPAAGEADDITVAAAGEASAPVFVDTTGRRGRRIRFVFHLAGGAASVYAVLVVIAALLFTGPLDLLSLPAPGQTASAPAPARQNTPTPVQAGKRTTGGLPGRGSPTPVAPSASAGPSGSATGEPTPEATTSVAPLASPSIPPAEPSPSATPAATQQSSAPAVTVLVVVGPA